MSGVIHIGDCLTVLRSLPAESVDCAISSPPYWGLRDYGVEGQIGLEEDLFTHIETLVAVFDEVRRVLKKSGTLWLNYGDAYASAPNGRSAADTKTAGNDDRTFRDKPISTVGPVRKSFRRDGAECLPSRRAATAGVLKAKDRMMLPARVALALQESGWWLRDEIVWHKPNPMPVSVKDRTTPAHEMLYLLSKSAKYYFDFDAMQEPASPNTHARRAKGGAVKITEKTAAATAGVMNNPSFSQGISSEVLPFRNRRSVWTIGTKAFKGAHFATFPPALIEPCILAGCPVGGTVLDPFFGAGTTGLVAARHGRRYVGIELNPEYAEIARNRIAADGLEDML